MRPLTALALLAPHGGYVPVDHLLARCPAYSRERLFAYLSRAATQGWVRFHYVLACGSHTVALP